MFTVFLSVNNIINLSKEFGSVLHQEKVSTQQMCHTQPGVGRAMWHIQAQGDTLLLCLHHVAAHHLSVSLLATEGHVVDYHSEVMQPLCHYDQVGLASDQLHLQRWLILFTPNLYCLYLRCLSCFVYCNSASSSHLSLTIITFHE